MRMQHTHPATSGHTQIHSPPSALFYIEPKRIPAMFLRFVINHNNAPAVCNYNHHTGMCLMDSGNYRHLKYPLETQIRRWSRGDIDCDSDYVGVCHVGRLVTCQPPHSVHL